MPDGAEFSAHVLESDRAKSFTERIAAASGQLGEANPHQALTLEFHPPVIERC